ncbi:MAG TPA: bifunctional DNA primase/polymerase [Streptosporangiaceae bacterium]|nr:bifunctional DNA primase/polymerase [Streptosporangiaceae bacterium]
MIDTDLGISGKWGVGPGGAHRAGHQGLQRRCRGDLRDRDHPAGPVQRPGNTATTDPQRIRGCWARGGYNIGAVTGPFGLVVIDLDGYEVGPVCHLAEVSAGLSPFLGCHQFG